MIRTPGWTTRHTGAPRAGRATAVRLVLPSCWLTLVVVWQLVRPPDGGSGAAPRIATCLAYLTAVVWLVVGVRSAAEREVRRIGHIAEAAQRVLLRPPPARLDGIALAAGQLSMSRGASVGGDLYEAMATPYGVRIVMGDVRGHGLPAIGAVAALLGSFREAAHDEPQLARVLRRLDRALARHLRERCRAEHPACGGGEPESPLAEEFVTVLLLEIRADGDVYALNCGHPWPYRLGPGAGQLAPGDPLPPLGPFPLPADLAPLHCVRLRPGEALCLHTDGAEDARDAAGRFFAFGEALAEAARTAPVSPAAVVARVQRALLDHTRGRLSDDVALLVLRNDRVRVPPQPVGSGAAGVRR
ncbi:PP2C family protein-serine/threonine phosphatase [Streptomyces sp. NBC_00083]|uniref:PP2C family protein-serine/threonine phosphatase n=1 Tax=Streptomyces sp. NBC_00083 TaxID=2975647 RepID=UPI0022597744|nr:PP2C family protein-serine/threonine phosphatase [Streptomyces sp. NBC_00083]MCX5383479.1 serine/threonine-protein phosphatase [Streptomyces sp. NBC_00083]